MPLTRPIGFLCYNNSELARDGYIEPSMSNVIPAEDFNFNKLKRNRKGVSYQLVKDDPNDPTKITNVIETRRLLPAEKLKVEIQFSKTLKNAVTNPIAPGSIPGAAGFFVGNLFSGIGFGGITSGFTDFVYDIIDSKTIINEAITVTQNILDTGIVEFETFPISIFGIVKEFQEGVIDEELFRDAHPQARIELDISGDLIGYIGLDFTGDQTGRIGQHSKGSYQGGPRKRIDGATNSKGQFGETGSPFINIVDSAGDSGNPPEQEVILLPGQNNIFLEIIRDHRKLKFRGDNKDVSGVRYYPFKNREVDDITDHNIRIDTADLNLDDIIYITYLTASERRVRQAMRHKGIVGQGNRFGVSGWNLEIGSEMDIFDYQIRDWIVHSEFPEENAPDSEFKISYNQYVNWKKIEERFNKNISESTTAVEKESLEQEKNEMFNENFRLLEGWRMSSIVTSRLEFMWAADYRGILLMTDRQPAIVVVPFTKIRDLEWFVDYLKSLDFIEKHIDPITKETIYDDLKIEIDRDSDRLKDMEEAPIDIGGAANAVLYDREKVPYYRPFALALQEISPFSEDDNNSGVGIISLDVLLNAFFNSADTGLTSQDFYTELMHSFSQQIQDFFLSFRPSLKDLKFADLSLSVFDWTTSSPTQFIECSDRFPIREFNYNCHTYDPSGGPGIWLTTSYIENQLFEWRPPGGFIESYWKMDTPYFCGDFKRDTRIYIEKVGGNSLDNFSWIYIDTRPDVIDSISIDKDVKKEKSYLSFYDNIVHNSLSYHVFSDGDIHKAYKHLGIDPLKGHSRAFLETDNDPSRINDVHRNQVLLGYNNMLGDSPSFTLGKPITNLESASEQFGLEETFEEDIWSNSSLYDLNFLDEVPKIHNVPFNWAFKNITVDYENIRQSYTPQLETYATVYFEGDDVAVNNFSLKEGPNDNGRNIISIDCSYYNAENIQLLGDIWPNIKINEIKATIIDEFDLKKYKIDEGQSSIVSDGQGKVLVFFADSINSNISVAISNDDTDTWEIHRNIIRLLSDESATFPIALQDSKNDKIHLFYVLNNAYIMYKSIDTKLFLTDDVWKLYQAPDYYNERSLDDDVDEPTSSLNKFTSSGRRLRQGVSYFALGDASSSFFIKQMDINKKIKQKNFNENNNQTIRFDFDGDEEEMDITYNGKSFAVNIDDKGLLRLFFSEERGFSVRVSSNFAKWEYIGRNLPLHKTYFSDSDKEENVPVISNIQIAKNYFNDKMLHVFYFYNNMLLMRRIPSNILNVQYDTDDNKIDRDLRLALQVDSNMEDSRPMFIVGQITDNILQDRLDEISINTTSSSIAIFFPYPGDSIARFDETMAIDTTTQIGAYATREGDIRVIYKDILGNLNAALITGDEVSLEIFYKVDKETLN